MILPEGVEIHIGPNEIYRAGDEVPAEIAQAHGLLPAQPTRQPRPQAGPAAADGVSQT